MLQRLGQAPMTAKEIAEAATMDAPAATVAVNDLEDRGLVVREIDPTNRRSKLSRSPTRAATWSRASTQSTTRRPSRSPR